MRDPYVVVETATNHLQDFLNEMHNSGFEIVSVMRVEPSISSWIIVMRGKSWNR
jgi:hypothetical protein